MFYTECNKIQKIIRMYFKYKYKFFRKILRCRRLEILLYVELIGNLIVEM